MKVLYPGSFDPIHNGHIEIVEIASKLFTEVVVAVVVNPQKDSMLSLEEREDLLEKSLKHLKNVSVMEFSSLVVDLAEEQKADAIVKGLRASADFENEFQMAQTNKEIKGVETIFLPSASKSSYIASKYIREIFRMGGDVSPMVPPLVLEMLKKKA